MLRLIIDVIDIKVLRIADNREGIYVITLGVITVAAGTFS